MNVSPKCTALVKRFEGCRLESYPDPGTGGDPWTIGYGATGASIHKGVVWSQAQADDRLTHDLASFADGVSKLLGNAPTTQNQFDALTSFAFNVGLENLAGSTLLKKHRAEDYAGAATEFAKWTHAAGKTLPGLITRRAAEAALYRSRP